MKTSCGIIIINEHKQILLGHATGQKHFDIPKGCLEDNETDIECVIRECEEETGIIFSPEEIFKLGNYPYNQYKNLTLFVSYITNFDIEELKCTATFEHPKTKQQLPEIDYFKWVDPQEISLHCAKSMSQLLNSTILPHLGLNANPLGNEIRLS